jgi:hypothetical protein
MFHPQSATRIKPEHVQRARQELIRLITDYGLGAIAAALNGISKNELRNKETIVGWDHVWKRTEKATNYIIEPIDHYVEIRKGDKITRYYPEDTQIELEQIEVVADPDPNYEWIPQSAHKISTELATKRLRARNSEDKRVEWSDLECTAGLIVTFQRIYSPENCRQSWLIALPSE